MCFPLERNAYMRIVKSVSIYKDFLGKPLEFISESAAFDHVLDRKDLGLVTY